MEFLLDACKAKIDAKDVNGATPLWWAVSRPCRASYDVAKLLVERGATLDITPEGREPMCIGGGLYITPRSQCSIRELLAQNSIDSSPKDQEVGHQEGGMLTD